MNLNPFSSEPPLARRLGSLPLHSIHTFPDGEVGRIVGAADHLADERPTAPLTGRPCVAWIVRVTGAVQRISDGAPVVEGRCAAPFTVRDATGEAVLRADHVSLLLAFDVVDTLGLSRAPPARLVRFLREQGGASRSIVMDWRLSWQEGILAEGERVAIVGRGRREADPEAGEGGYRNAAMRLVMERGGEQNELFASTFAGSLRGGVTAARGG